MWNTLSQAAALVTGETEEVKDDKNVDDEDKEKLQHQDLLIQQLKDLVRENEKRFQEKAKEYDDLSTKHDKFKLQSKAKIAQLSKQIKGQDKTAKKEDCDFDDASSTDSTDRSHRGKVILYKKQLDQAKQQLEKKEEESKKIIGTYERKITDLELQLNEKNILISSFAELKQEKSAESSPKKETSIQEMYAQIVYKDSKILDLNNQILEHEKKIMDLQENIKEKDEVLQQRNKAVQLMAEDLNRKGQSTILELDETRDQMKMMQHNFADIESDWKAQLGKYQQKIDDLENEIKEWDSKLKNSEASVKSIETVRYELSVKNAELQKKIVCVQEGASKQCEQFNKEIQGEIEVLKASLESEKQRCAELQKALDDSNNDSKNKVFKARVEERSKAKKLERELNEMKKGNRENPEEVLDLQQRVAELEEEKGSLQLKLMEIEDQVSQIEKLKEDNVSVQKVAEEALSKIEVLEKQIQEHQQENQSWKSKFDALQNDYNMVKEKCDILSKEHFDAQEAMSALIIAKKTLDDEHNELKQKQINVEKDCKELELSLQKTNDEKVTFELKTIELEEIRDKDDEAKKRLALKIEELEDMLNDESKPLIHLERENTELKQKLQLLEESHNELHDQGQKMVLQIESLQRSLTGKEAGEVAKTEQLNNKIMELENNNLQLQKTLDVNAAELVNLEGKVAVAQNDVAKILDLFGVEDLNNLAQVKNEADAIVLIKENLQLSLIERDNTIKHCNFNIDSLQSCINKLKSDFTSHETLISDLKSNISEKNELIKKLTADLENKITTEKLLNESLGKKDELILKFGEEQVMLKKNLEKAEGLLTIEHSKAEDKLKTFLEQISDLEKELTDLREELMSATDLTQELRSDIHRLNEENEVLYKKCEENMHILLEKDNSIQELNSNIQNKHSEIENLNQKLKHLDTLMKSKDANLSKLNEDLLEKTKSIEMKEEHIKEVKQALAEVSEVSHMDKDKLREQMILEKRNFEVTILNLKAEKDCLSESLESKTRELNALHSDFLEMKTVMEDLENQNAGFKAKLSDAHEEKCDFMVSSDNQFKQIVELDKLCMNLKKEKSQLESKMFEVMKTAEKLQEDLKDATIKIEKYKKKCEELENQVDQLKKDLTESNDLEVQYKTQLFDNVKKIETLTFQHDLMKGDMISLQEVQDGELAALRKEIALQVQKAESYSSEIKETSENLQEDLNATTMELERYKKQCKELENQVDLLKKDLKESNDLEVQHKTKLLSNENEMKNLTSQHDLLKRDITSLQEKQDGELADLRKKMTLKVNKAKAKAANVEMEKSKLSELYSSLQTSLQDSALEIENQVKMVSSTKEEKIALENEVLKYKEDIKTLEDKINVFENDNTIAKMKLSGEKSEMELLLQNTMSDNKKLLDSVAELKIKITQLTEENRIIHERTERLESAVNDKEFALMQLQSQLTVTEEKASKLQKSLDESMVENETYKQTFEKKLACADECKKHYYILLNALKSSLQVGVDISFLEPDISDMADEFAMLSKNASDVSIECLLKNEDCIQLLKDEVFKLKEENTALHHNLKTYKESLSDISVAIQNDMSINRNKFNEITCAFQEKEHAIGQMCSKLESLKSKSELNNSLINEQTQSLGKLVDKVLEQTIITCNIMNASSPKGTDYSNIIDQLDNIANSPYNKNCLTTISDRHNNVINQYIEATTELGALLWGKTDLVAEINVEKEKCELAISNLKSELLSEQANVDALNHKVQQLNDELTHCSLESSHLELANIKINELQGDVESYRHKLITLEEEKSSLQQKIEDSKKSLQQSADEKAKFESNLEQMCQDLTGMQLKQDNKESCLKQKEALIVDYEKEISHLKDQMSDLESLYQKNADMDCKIVSLEKGFEFFKGAVYTLKSSFKEGMPESLDFPSLILDIPSENVNQFLAELYSDFNYILVACADENKNSKNQIKLLESKIINITEELETTKELLSKNKAELDNITASKESQRKVDIITVSSTEPVFETDLVQQQASPNQISKESFKSLEEDKNALKEELNEYKKKFAKLLSKLKLFKDEKERLSKELQDLQNAKSQLEITNAKNLDKIHSCQEQMALVESEKEKLKAGFQSNIEQTKHELSTSNSVISQMKDRYSNLEENFFKVQHNLHEYKQTWEQTNISFELQKEDNERLKVKLKNMKDEFEDSKSRISELNLQLKEFEGENIRFKQEAENLREHADMLISDNDTYQNCIEKLTAAKNSLEQKVAELKKNFDAELRELLMKHETQLKEFSSEPSKESEALLQLKIVENESLKNLCTDLQLQHDTLKHECETYKRNQQLLEKEKVYLQHQLLEKSNELQNLQSSSDVANKAALYSSGKHDGNVAIDLESENYTGGTSQLEVTNIDENNVLKQQLSALVQELNFTKETISCLQKEHSSKEISYNERIGRLENQLQHYKSTSVPSQENKYRSTQLESELQQAMGSLHNQGLRCEELSLEVSKLLEERNILKWKLHQYIQLTPEASFEPDSFSVPSPSDLTSVKVDSPNDIQIAALHERLIQSERTCQELRKANEALDRALINEKDQKRIIEEELDLAKEHITEDTRPNDEYHILLGDISDPEMFTETNFSISRNVRTNAYKLRRWLRGRRNYLCRTVKSRNYPHLVYLFYIFFIHIWLLSCVFS